VTIDAFAEARPRLLGIAYRMLGSRAEAEDVVGDVAERWTVADRSQIVSPEAWLVTVTTRRALDVLRAARLRRVDYPGEWLPEPVATDGDPTIEVERRETLTMGFLLLLERLTPIERAVFVLHDVLEHPHELVADAVGRSEDTCRQALRRARRHVTVPARQPPAARRHAEEVARRFMALDIGGDLDALVAALSPEIAVSSDGGGIVHAGMRSVTGPHRSARFLHNLAARAGADALYVPCELNGEPAVLMHGADGWAAVVVTLVDDRIGTVRIVANPAKLERLVATLAAGSGRPGPWEAAGRFRHRGGQRV
jgi:RNA polymerase sigma-70 factor (ECF subfamily)